MELDWIIVVGAFCLGALIGMMVSWYYNSKVPTTSMLAASISALVGSSVLAMFSFLAGLRGPTHEYWFYPIGLFVGFVVVTIIEIQYWGYDGKKRQRLGK